MKEITQTMTSVELTEVINSYRPDSSAVLLHKNLMAKIEAELLPIAELNVQPSSYSDNNRQERPCYQLDKDACLLLVSGEVISVRLALIKRLNELEKATRKEIPTDFPTALRLYADTLEMNAKLEADVAEKMLTITDQRQTITDKKTVTNEGDDYYSITRMRKLNGSQGYSGKRLAIYSDVLKLPTVPLFAMSGIATNTYHKAVWTSAYPNVHF